MSFAKRSQQSEKLVQITTEELWNRSPFRERCVHAPFGQETHVVQEAIEILRDVHEITAQHIRYAPDFFVVDRHRPKAVYLLEYKCSQRPLFAEWRISEAAGAIGKPSLDWQSIGDWEAAAYDNYIRLSNAGVRVAILYYCAYHPRPLLCDFVTALKGLYRSKVLTMTPWGSRTPVLNFDMNDLRTLDDFLTQEHGLAEATIGSLCNVLQTRLLNEMPVDHHPKSPYLSK
jgi:hypothetical protein